MRQFVTLLMFIILGTACVPGRLPSNQVLASELADKTVTLVEELDAVEAAMAGASQHVYCSGVWVGPRLILTAGHCVDDKEIGDEVEYSMLQDFSQFKDRQVILPHAAHLVAKDQFHDLAMIHADLVVNPHQIAVVGVEDLAAGQRVVTMGAPVGNVYSFSSGDIAAIRYIQQTDPDDDTAGSMWFIQATAPISPGNSGGGLFDMDGKLIGICRMTSRRGQNINFFVHRDYVAHFVSEWVTDTVPQYIDSSL